MRVITWSSICGAYHVRCEASACLTQCCIFHDNTSDVCLGDVPHEWTVCGTPVHALKLPCGHAYNISAIATHFLSRDMRCPVCRAGHPGPMCLDAVPESMRSGFASKMASLRPDACVETGVQMRVLLLTAREATKDLRLSVETGCIVRDHTGESCFTGSVCFADTVLCREGSGATTDSMLFQTHRNFRRKVDAFICRHESEADRYIRFYLDHPLFGDVFTSPRIAVADLEDTHRYEMHAPNVEGAAGHVQFSHAVPSTGVPHTVAVFVHHERVVSICMETIQRAFSRQLVSV